jgi:hypothetical protein
LQDVVDDDFDGPRFKNVAEGFAEHGDEGKSELLPIRPDEANDA